MRFKTNGIRSAGMTGGTKACAMLARVCGVERKDMAKFFLTTLPEGQMMVFDLLVDGAAKNSAVASARRYSA